MGANQSAAARGAVAGVLAATAIALFFLVLDLAQGEPFRTPAFLSSVLLGPEAASPGLGGVALYTVIHYVIFALLGAAVGWLLARAGLPAALLLGVVLGFLLFDAVFYAGVSLTGVDVVDELGWPAFLVGNLLGGLVLFWYLGRSGPLRRRSWSEVFREHAIVREGLIAGAVGAGAMALWFFLVDLVMGRLLLTPAALGSALFLGATTPGGVEYSVAPILGYTIFHLAVFVAVGITVAALVSESREHPSLLLALVLLAVTFETLVLGLIAILASWLLEELAWWSVAVGSVVAALAMGVYLWKRNPRLSGDLGRAEESVAERSPGAGTVSASRNRPATP